MYLQSNVNKLKTMIAKESRSIYDNKEINEDRMSNIKLEGTQLLSVLERVVDNDIDDDVESLSYKIPALSYSSNDPYLTLLQLNSIDDKLSNIAQYLND